MRSKKNIQQTVAPLAGGANRNRMCFVAPPSTRRAAKRIRDALLVIGRKKCADLIVSFQSEPIVLRIAGATTAAQERRWMCPQPKQSNGRANLALPTITRRIQMLMPAPRNRSVAKGSRSPPTPKRPPEPALRALPTPTNKQVLTERHHAPRNRTAAKENESLPTPKRQHAHALRASPTPTKNQVPTE
jgi:hypothetical protein